MSGGHFDYLERRVFDLVNEIQESEELFYRNLKRRSV
jgi:hypothetical protein